MSSKARTQSRCGNVCHGSDLYCNYMEHDHFDPLEFLIRIFSSDTVLLKDAVIALKQYFAAFIFMDLQYIGQTVFKSLNKKKFATFFSLLRKVFYSRSAYLPDAICPAHGNQRRVPGRTCVKCDRRKHLLCDHALYCTA